MALVEAARLEKEGQHCFRHLERQAETSEAQHSTALLSHENIRSADMPLDHLDLCFPRAHEAR